MLSKMKKMKIGELKEILKEFDDDDKSVFVFLKESEKSGVVYEVENLVNNDGHLDLWISFDKNEYDAKQLELLKK